MEKYLTINSRQFKRVQAHSLVKFQGVDQYGKEEPWISNVKDISAGGLRFWSEHFFPEATLLRLSVWIPALERPLDALARIVRVRPARNGEMYYLSVRFIEVSQDLQKALNDFIERLASDKKTRRYVDDFTHVKRQSAAGKI